MKFPNSRTFFLLRTDSLGLQKSGPSFGRKAGAQAAHRYGSAQHDESMMHAVRARFIRHHNLLHHDKDSLLTHFIPGF
jgi:hypothetical protein